MSDEKFLCPEHETVPRLKESVDRRCLMHCNPSETVPMYYEQAEICEECSRNTGFCVICQEPIAED